MNIRPIDLQILIPNSTEASKVQHSINQRDAEQQQAFANQWQQVTQQRQKQVQNLNHAEGGKVTRQKEHTERNKEDRSGQKHKDKDGSDESKKSLPGVLGTTIDIKT